MESQESEGGRLFHDPFAGLLAAGPAIHAALEQAERIPRRTFAARTRLAFGHTAAGAADHGGAHGADGQPAGEAPGPAAAATASSSAEGEAPAAEPAGPAEDGPTSRAATSTASDAEQPSAQPAARAEDEGGDDGSTAPAARASTRAAAGEAPAPTGASPTASVGAAASVSARSWGSPSRSGTSSGTGPRRRYKVSNPASRVWWFDRQILAALNRPVRGEHPNGGGGSGSGSGGVVLAPAHLPALLQPPPTPRQVVVLGAGMDARPWRLGGLPEVCVHGQCHPPPLLAPPRP